MSAEERRLWLLRAELERRAGRLTALHVAVGRALLKRLSVDGRCDPSHATIAADVGCGERTVRRALGGLREAGMLSWEQRLVRKAWPTGGAGASRAEQTSNAYLFTLPTGPVMPPVPRAVQRRLPLPHCGGQDGRETPSLLIPRELPRLTEAEVGRLEAIQADRKARREKEWLAQRAEQWRGRG